MKLTKDLSIFIWISLMFSSHLLADISGSGDIKFRAEHQGPVIMQMQSQGLGIGTVPSANLHVKGNMAFHYQMVSSNTTLSGNSFIFVDSSSDNITLTLPFAGNVDGHIYKIKKTSRLNYVNILDSHPSHEEEYIFSPTTVEESLSYAEFFSASSNWHLLSRENISEDWTPAASSNTSVWLDASDDSTITSSGDNVTQWNDKSGNDYHVTQSTANAHPKTGTRTLNNLNVIDFDGSSDSLAHNAAFFSDDQSYTKVIVYLIDTTATNNNTLTIGNSAFYNEINIFHNGVQVSASSYPGASVAMIAMASYESGVRADLYIDGSHVGSNTSPPAAWANGAFNFQVARYGGGNYLDGILAEAIIFDHALNSETREKLEGYLAWKWNLRDRLPSTHPYKNNPSAK